MKSLKNLCIYNKSLNLFKLMFKDHNIGAYEERLIKSLNNL